MVTDLTDAVNPEPATAPWRTPAARAGSVAVGVYVSLSALPLLLSTSRGVAPWYVIAVHVALLAALVTTLQIPRDGWRGILGDWLPLAMIPFLYAELPFVMAGIAPGAATAFHDPLVGGWERALFGEPARTLAAALPNAVLSELLHASYLLYYPLIYVPPLFVYLHGDRDTFHRVVAALVTTFAICFAIFAIFPVQGPRYLGVAPAPDGFVRSLVLRVLESGSSRGAAFPSSHVAVAVAQVVLAAQRGSRLLPVYALITAGLSVGAVYGGFHYGIDVAVGAALGALIPFALRADRREAAR